MGGQRRRSARRSPAQSVRLTRIMQAAILAIYLPIRSKDDWLFPVLILISRPRGTMAQKAASVTWHNVYDEFTHKYDSQGLAAARRAACARCAAHAPPRQRARSSQAPMHAGPSAAGTGAAMPATGSCLRRAAPTPSTRSRRCARSNSMVKQPQIQSASSARHPVRCVPRHNPSSCRPLLPEPVCPNPFAQPNPPQTRGGAA